MVITRLYLCFDVLYTCDSDTYQSSSVDSFPPSLLICAELIHLHRVYLSLQIWLVSVVLLKKVREIRHINTLNDMLSLSLLGASRLAIYFSSYDWLPVRFLYSTPFPNKKLGAPEHKVYRYGTQNLMRRINIRTNVVRSWIICRRGLNINSRTN